MNPLTRSESAIQQIKRSLMAIVLLITLIQLVGYGLLISHAIEAFHDARLSGAVARVNHDLLQGAAINAREALLYQRVLTGQVLPSASQQQSWQRLASQSDDSYRQAFQVLQDQPTLAPGVWLPRLQASQQHRVALRQAIWQRLASRERLPDETLSFELMLAEARLFEPTLRLSHQLGRRVGGNLDEETARLQDLLLSLWQVQQRVMLDRTARIARQQLGHALNDTAEAEQQVNRQLAANALAQVQDDLQSLSSLLVDWHGGELAQAFVDFQTQSQSPPVRQVRQGGGVAGVDDVQLADRLVMQLQRIRQQADHLLQQHIAQQSIQALNTLLLNLLILLLAILLNVLLFFWLLRRVLRPLDLFNAIQDGAREAMLLTDSAGRVFMANRGAQSLFALSEAQLTACSLTELVSEPALEGGMLAQLADSGQEVEARAQGGNGAPLPVSLIASRIRLGGLLQGVLVILRDDSQRHAAEQARQYSLHLMSDVSRLQNLLFTPILREVVFDELLQVLLRYACSQGGVLLETHGLNQTARYRCRARAGEQGPARDQAGMLSDLQRDWLADSRWLVFPVSLQQGVGGVVALWGSDTSAMQGSYDALLALYVSLLGFVREEEARKQSAERLGRVMQELEGIFKASPAGLILLDGQQRIVKLNHPVCQLFGVEAAALMLADLTALLGPVAGWQGLQRQIERVQAGKPAMRCELTCHSRAGGVLWLLCESRLLHDAHPDDGLILSCTDITSIKQTELALRDARDSAAEARHRLSAAIEALPEAFAFYDDTDRLIICNQHYVNLFFDGNSTDQVVGESFESLVRLSLMSADERIEPGFTPETWLAERVRRHRQPDSTFVLQIGARWYLASDQQIPGLGTVCLRADITELKAQQQALEVARQQADQASAAKSAFLATISHEIRTPLNGILGLLELLRLAEQDPQRLETFASVQGSAQTLLSLIDDILDFSKIEAGRLQLNPEPVALPALLQSVHALYREAAARKQLVYLLRLPDELAPAHLVDPLRLRQILQNFLSNALKFTEQGTVELALTVLESDAHSQRLQFSCRDSGIGIAAADQTQLFQPFTQAESSTTRRFGGTGLGLAICRRLAGLMAGEVAMESQPGQGTTVSLCLCLPRAVAPLVPVSNAATFDATVVFEVAAPVLFAEDNAVNRKLIAMQLDRLGLPYLVAEDGRQALTIWQQQPVALILTDCHMPVMDGHQLAREVRQLEAAQPDRARVPILVCTADVASDEAPRALACGIDEVLSKPLGLQSLQQALARWLPTHQQTGVAEGPAQQAPALLTASPEVVDRSVLAMYSQGDAAIEAELIRDFLDSEAPDWQALQQAVAEQLPERIRWYAHRLKGAARMVGAMTLGDMAQQLEQQSEQSDQSVAALAEVEQAWQAVVDWLAAQLPALAGADPVL